MDFSSVPVYLDPQYWQQQRNHQALRNDNLHQINPLLPPPSVPRQHVGAASGGSIRPSSMADRSKLAKITQSDTLVLKCPRCDSTNTKFCYFNNYSLSQPRHFCKTCRRYWTRGGALRNVPVGGSCRRNKKSKSRRNKSSTATTTENHLMITPSSTSTSIPTAEIIGHSFPAKPPQFPFATSLQNFSRYGAPRNIELNIHHDMGFQNMGISTNSAGTSSILSGGGLNHQQYFPFLGGFESLNSSLYPFQSEDVENPPSFVEDSTQVQNLTSNNSRVGTDDQLAPIKVEENPAAAGNTSRLGFSLGVSDKHNNQFWNINGNVWTDLSGLVSSSSTSHLL